MRPLQPAQGGRHSPILELSDELILGIFRYLDPADLFSVNRVCRRFRRIGSDQTLWIALLLRMEWASLPAPRWERLTSRNHSLLNDFEWRWGRIGEQNLLILLDSSRFSAWSLPQKEQLFSHEVEVASSLRLSLVGERLFALFQSGQAILVWNVGSGALEKRVEIGEAIAGTDLLNGELLIVGRETGEVSRGHFLSDERARFRVGGESRIKRIWRFGEELYLLRDNQTLEGWHLGIMERSQFWSIDLSDYRYNPMRIVDLIPSSAGELFVLSYKKGVNNHHLALFPKGAIEPSMRARWPATQEFVYPSFASISSQTVTLWTEERSQVEISLETGALSKQESSLRQLFPLIECNAEKVAKSAIDLRSGERFHFFFRYNFRLPLAPNGEPPFAEGIIAIPRHLFILREEESISQVTLEMADLCDERSPELSSDDAFLPIFTITIGISIIVIWRWNRD